MMEVLSWENMMEVLSWEKWWSSGSKERALRRGFPFDVTVECFGKALEDESVGYGRYYKLPAEPL
jgi:hypothetical protein